MMPRAARLLLPLLCTAFLSGCATPGDGLTARTTMQPAVAPDASAYGLFLSGQLALDSGDSVTAARLLGAAVAREPEVPAIRERAFMAALMTGDVAAAARLAPTPAATPEAEAEPVVAAGPPPAAGSAAETRTAIAQARVQRDAARQALYGGLARLTQGVDGLARGDGEAAVVALNGEMGAHEAAALLLRPWAAAAAGDWETALAEPPAAGETDITLSIRQLNRALLLEQRGRRAEADAAFTVLTGPDARLNLLFNAHARYLERTGRPAEAVPLYDRALGNDSNDDVASTGRARAAAGRRAPPRPTLREGAARSLLLPAVALLSAQQREIGVMYLRLVLHLDPELDDAWLLAGDAFEAMEDRGAARTAYAEIDRNSANYVAAQARIISSLQADGDTAGALRLARQAAAAAPDDAQVRLTLAGLLVQQEAYAEAATLLERSDWRADWRAAYLRGIALERSGRWPEAEASLQAALALQPNEAELLNYLGYAWIDRGERLAEASTMLDRAMQAQPESGAIVDSVGWARYRLGQYEDAVRLLERAVQLEPGDPTVNDHLGDAYWRVGRRTEARFQWRRALSLEPEPEVRTAAEAKLASDLGPDAPGGRLEAAR